MLLSLYPYWMHPFSDIIMMLKIMVHMLWS
jgi:hypothetical protein